MPLEKIGIIETKESIVYLRYEVVRINERLYAGADAFSWPSNSQDLRALECLEIPGEWQWVERYIEAEPDYGEDKKNLKGKYNVVRGAEAKNKMLQILSRHEVGVLSLIDNDRPYAIPINHVYKDGKLYLHSGKKGKKIQLVKRNVGACYTIFGLANSEIKNVRSCHLDYESILFKGNVYVEKGDVEKERALKAITKQYGTPYQHGFSDMIEIIVFEVETMTARDQRFKPDKNRNLYFYNFLSD
ncbi:MAG: pyridoxamine 5'-phosphate oxidase family protein [Ruminococcaceae bacterium]|nr:pyridoxamine 5'-phosphate oxidase family protein [Oscillospiraceae bacterium]